MRQRNELYNVERKENHIGLYEIFQNGISY